MLKKLFRSLLGFKLSAQFRSWTNAVLNTVALWLGKNELDISDCSAPARESCLELNHKLRSQKTVLMFAKTADTENYEALKSIYLLLKAAWDTTEDSTFLSVGDSYTCEQTDQNLRRFGIGTIWELSREQNNRKNMCDE